MITCPDDTWYGSLPTINNLEFRAGLIRPLSELIMVRWACEPPSMDRPCWWSNRVVLLERRLHNHQSAQTSQFNECLAPHLLYFALQQKQFDASWLIIASHQETAAIVCTDRSGSCTCLCCSVQHTSPIIKDSTV